MLLIAYLKEHPAYIRRERAIKVKADVIDAPVSSQHFFFGVLMIIQREVQR